MRCVLREAAIVLVLLAPGIACVVAAWHRA